MSVAILLPVFNCEDTINQTIDSLLNQTFSDFTLYIINNNCTDKTIDNINRHNDKRIKIHDYRAIQRCSAALNYGLDIIQEEYICRADGDDVYHKKYVEYYTNELYKNQHKIVYGSYRFTYYDGKVEETARIIDLDLLIWRLMFFNTVDHNVGYARRYIQELGQYNTLLHSEDYDLWLRSLLNNQESICGISSDEVMCECFKSKKCMTVLYRDSNSINTHLSAEFIRKYLNVPADRKLISKLKEHLPLTQGDITSLNCLLDSFCKKRKISRSKLLKYEKEFYFYV